MALMVCVCFVSKFEYSFFSIGDKETSLCGLNGRVVLSLQGKPSYLSICSIYCINITIAEEISQTIGNLTR